MFTKYRIAHFRRHFFGFNGFVYVLAGKLVTQKREELGHLLEQFNIQVDNPIEILNQDTSRNFLHSTNPKNKYQVK